MTMKTIQATDDLTIEEYSPRMLMLRSISLSAIHYSKSGAVLIALSEVEPLISALVEAAAQLQGETARGDNITFE